MTIDHRVAVFRQAGAIIGESLWWNATAHAMEWCDITNGLLHRSPLNGAIDGSDDRVIEFPPPVGAFQPRVGGGYVCADERSVFVCAEDGGHRRTLTHVEHAHSGIRFNEAKCDPFGSFVVGSMDVTEGEPDGALYVVSPAGACTTLLGGITVANGFEWSDDGSRMYFTDTAAETIYVADYDGRSMTNVEPFVRGRQSDGLARDADGGFWNGINDVGTLVHWDADGQFVEEIDIPAGHVTSVAFGGPDLSILFVATAREKLTEEELERQPLTGSVFRIQTSTHGYPVHAFGTTS